MGGGRKPSSPSLTAAYQRVRRFYGNPNHPMHQQTVPETERVAGVLKPGDELLVKVSKWLLPEHDGPTEVLPACHLYTVPMRVGRASRDVHIVSLVTIEGADEVLAPPEFVTMESKPAEITAIRSSTEVHFSKRPRDSDEENATDGRDTTCDDGRNDTTTCDDDGRNDTTTCDDGERNDTTTCDPRPPRRVCLSVAAQRKRMERFFEKPTPELRAFMTWNIGSIEPGDRVSACLTSLNGYDTVVRVTANVNCVTRMIVKGVTHSVCTIKMSGQEGDMKVPSCLVTLL